MRLEFFKKYQVIVGLVVGYKYFLISPHQLQSLEPQQVTPEVNVPTTTARRDCGVYYYYHVGKTGGTSVMQWQQDAVSFTRGKVRHLDWFYDYNKNYQNGVWKTDLEHKILPEIERVLSHRQSWFSLHQHHLTPGLRLMVPLLRQWRQRLEAEGCQLVTTVTLRDPKSWIESLVTYNEIPSAKLEHYVNHTREGQAIYLLYNFFDRIYYHSPANSASATNWKNASSMDLSPWAGGHTVTHAELEEVLGYLQHDFDIVGQTHHMDHFFEQSLSLTGWAKDDNSTTNSGTTAGGANTGLPAKNPHINKTTRKRASFTAQIKSIMAHSVHQDEILWQRMFG